jgi:hypothetical protein
MDSINQQQPEDNYEDLLGAEAIKKLKEINDKATASAPVREDTNSVRKKNEVVSN